MRRRPSRAKRASAGQNAEWNARAGRSADFSNCLAARRAYPPCAARGLGDGRLALWRLLPGCRLGTILIGGVAPRPRPSASHASARLSKDASCDASKLGARRTGGLLYEAPQLPCSRMVQRPFPSIVYSGDCRGLCDRRPLLRASREWAANAEQGPIGDRRTHNGGANIWGVLEASFAPAPRWRAGEA